MTELTALWLPMLLAAVLVFVASSIIHMAPLWHRSDYPRLANEEAVMSALRPLNLPDGDYFFPRPKPGESMNSPEFQARMKEGPMAMMTVFPKGMGIGMGRQLSLWFVFCLVVSLLAGYVASAALPPGTPYLRVFQLAGVTAFIGYSVALWELSIWYRRAWSMTLKGTLDGLIYGLLTGGVFGWLWPTL